MCAHEYPGRPHLKNILKYPKILNEKESSNT